MSEITNWLIVESFANWEVDFANNFSYFGLTARFEKLAKEMTPGDLLFTYVTVKSCFSDIRKLTKAGPRRLPMGGGYEISLPLRIDTAPELVLDPKQWLPIGEVRERLKLIEGKAHWGQMFRSAPRRQPMAPY